MALDLFGNGELFDEMFVRTYLPWVDIERTKAMATNRETPVARRKAAEREALMYGKRSSAFAEDDRLAQIQAVLPSLKDDGKGGVEVSIDELYAVLADAGLLDTTTMPAEDPNDPELQREMAEIRKYAEANRQTFSRFSLTPAHLTKAFTEMRKQDPGLTAKKFLTNRP